MKFLLQTEDGGNFRLEDPADYEIDGTDTLVDLTASELEEYEQARVTVTKYQSRFRKAAYGW
jgi:hypothetical protein